MVILITTFLIQLDQNTVRRTIHTQLKLNLVDLEKKNKQGTKNKKNLIIKK